MTVAVMGREAPSKMDEGKRKSRAGRYGRTEMGRKAVVRL